MLLLQCLLFSVRSQHSSTSVLASGDWYKIAVLTDGVYRIDARFLSQSGIDPSGLQADKLAVYGNSYNGMLPQANSTTRPDDLLENATYRVGLDDGSFDDGDYILFYGKSPDSIAFDSATEDFYFEKNLYSDTAFYFLTVKEDAALSMENQGNLSTSEPFTTSYLRFQPHELEDYNMLNTGRQWFGERVNTSSRTTSINFDPQGIITDSEVKVYTSVMSEASTPSSFVISLNDINLGTIEMDPVSTVAYQTRADIQTATFTTLAPDLSNEELELDYTFELTSGTVGAVDYAHIVTENELALDDEPLQFFSRSEDLAFEIANAENAVVWDISDPVNAKLQESSITNGGLTFGPPLASTQFIVFRADQAREPLFIERVANQNLHALPAAEVIYITHKNFLQEAERLADFRLAQSGLTAEVVTVSQIYNEYSSGRQDVSAIRDFIKHQYDKYSQTLEYVTLVGDCSYDYKKRTTDTNFVPVYESRNSIHEIQSYSSDDYFGFMDDDEGEWIETSQGDHTLNIGIGRIPSQTVEETALFVNKIMRYETSTSGFGKWRNNIAFVADDGDSNIHQNDAEDLSEIVIENQKNFNIEKVYLDAFQQIDLPNGQESPEASKEFLNAFTKGNLIVNYTGHGNTKKLMDESTLVDDMIEDLTNRHLMPFFITATCEFGNYDSPTTISGGEQILLHQDGGAIGLLCSTRPVYSNTNYLLNEAFYEAALNKVDGEYPRLGDMIRVTKNNSLRGTRNRNYALLGDASMRLAFPEQSIALTGINGKTVDELDTLSALGEYSISGEILIDDVRDESYNGRVTVSIFDKPSQFETYGDESQAQIFEKQDVLLFQGEASVVNGTFTTEFVVPLNMDYSYSFGKISFYAINELENLDAHGAFNEVVVGGASGQLISDNTPPAIEIYMDDLSFSSGDKVDENSLLLVRLSDDNGINISEAGFGHNVTLTLDDENPISINEYYTASLDTYQEGWVAFPLENMDKGRHSLRIAASDVLNNRSESSVEFVVSQEASIGLSNVGNYPNPMTDGTTFTFTHDREGEVITTGLTVMNFQGQVIMNNNYRFLDSNSKIDLFWNGRDTSGNRLKKGIYIYKITVQSESDGAKTEKYQRLIVLN